MKTAFGVVVAHLLTLALLVYAQSPSKKHMPRKMVMVKTYVQNNQLQKPKYLKLDKPISLLRDPPPKEEIPQPAPQPLAEGPQPVKIPETEVKSEAVKQEASKSPSIEKKEVKEKPASKPASKPAPKVAPKAVNAQPVKKATSEKPAKPKEVKKATPSTKTVKSTPNQDKLISLMQESLQTLNATGKKSGTAASTTSSNSKSIGKLASEALTLTANYEDALVCYLEERLTLPEKGNVKMKLTLKREGSVQEIVILNASSQKNRNYVESSLTSCCFPDFGSQFKGETTHTFTITLTSEDSR